MIFELNHLGIHVKDAQRTIDFYTKHFGAKINFEKKMPGRAHIVYIQIADGMIEIVETGRADFKIGYDHICFMTDSIHEDYEKLLKAGCTVHIPPSPAASGNGILCKVFDSNGIIVELIQREDTFRRATITDTDIHGFDHIAITAKDLGVTEKFWTETLSMEVVNRSYWKDMDVTMNQLYKFGGSIELMHGSRMGSQSDLIKHMAFRVDNVDEMFAKLQSEGIVFEKGYPKDAVTGLGRTAKFTGPDGEVIDIIDRDAFR